MRETCGSYNCKTHETRYLILIKKISVHKQNSIFTDLIKPKKLIPNVLKQTKHLFNIIKKN